MSEQGTVDALGRCSRCGQHVQSSAGCDCHTRPTNDAKKMLLGERVAELACAELDKEYAYKMFSHFKGSGEPVEKQVTALEYFQNEAFEEIRKQSSKSNEQEG